MIQREVLEFVVRHTAHKSIKCISRVAGTDSGNLHACLAGKRPLSAKMVRCAAAAVGLIGSGTGDQMRLELVRDAVINLEIDCSELEQLSQALSGLSLKPPEWRLFRTYGESPDPGVYAVAIAYLGTGYVIANITWPSIAAVPPIEDISSRLEGYWTTVVPAEHTLNTDSVLWIRLRAGVIAKSWIDDRFLVRQAPSIEEWAQMLLDVSKLGKRPEEITRIVSRAVSPRKTLERVGADENAQAGDDDSAEDNG